MDQGKGDPPKFEQLSFGWPHCPSPHAVFMGVDLAAGPGETVMTYWDRQPNGQLQLVSMERLQERG